MAKRFTDTSKWNKPFIRRLQAPYKLLWLYIIDECDHAGIWQVDFQIAEIKIGEKLNQEKAIEQLGEKIFVFDDGEKWFINSFIEFQYGKLNPENRAHLSVISILSKYDLIDEENQIKPLTSPLQGAKDKDKVQGTVFNKKDYETFLTSFNQITNKAFKGTTKDKSQFNARMKDGYTVEQIILALKKAMKEEYHVNSKFKYLTPEFITRPDKLERFDQQEEANDFESETYVEPVVDVVKLLNERRAAAKLRNEGNS